ncbi:helix-turn-helix transcriptional regulator [Gordonia cholesterolivorans]|uniref:Helix-turn-helix transcriptional regulator n=1 Tax=Gordonia cholesterolivorans TaxID=559625 RepID=A0ABN3I2P6_9ACTN
MGVVAIVRTPLLREALGEHLRSLRLRRGERLADTAARAGVSVQYLSEIERGRKDPSSEMIAAVVGALDTTLGDVTVAVGEHLRETQPTAAAPAPSRPTALACAA